MNLGMGRDWLKGLDVPMTELPPGSPQGVLSAIAACKLDVQNEFYQEYLANLAAEKYRQRAQAEAETSIAP